MKGYSLMKLCMYATVIGFLVFSVMSFFNAIFSRNPCKRDCEAEHHLEYQNYYKDGNVCLCKTGEGTGLVNIYE